MGNLHRGKSTILAKLRFRDAHPTFSPKT